MKYIEEYLNDVIKIKPLGELTTKDDELNGMSGEMVYIDGKCSDIFISHADYANWLEKRDDTSVFYVPEISIKDAVEVTSRMQYIEDDMKPIAEFILDYAYWDLHKDKWNQPTLTVPLFRVLDALIQRGKPYGESVQNIEKQCEQKPVSITDEWVEDYWQHEKVYNPYSYDKGEEIQFDHQGFVRFCKKYCKKPAWSEEDNRKIKFLINLVNEWCDKAPSATSMVKEEMSDWLKSLKDKRFPQYRQRQYEDITDEELLQARKDAYNDALDKIEYHSDTPTFIDGWSAAIWYLKKRNAMPSQRRWEPSDEQLAALYYIFHSYNPPASEKIAWDSLKEIEIMYWQLKKLKEE